MAVPKKKVSRSRRNMRRFSSFNRLTPVTTIIDPITTEPVRPHTILGVEFAAAYVERRKAAKALKSSGSRQNQPTGGART